MCRHEPRLDELLADPLIRLVMASDAVQEDDIRRFARPGPPRASWIWSQATCSPGSEARPPL